MKMKTYERLLDYVTYETVSDGNEAAPAQRSSEIGLALVRNAA